MYLHDVSFRYLRHGVLSEQSLYTIMWIWSWHIYTAVSLCSASLHLFWCGCRRCHCELHWRHPAYSCCGWCCCRSCVVQAQTRRHHQIWVGMDTRMACFAQSLSHIVGQQACELIVKSPTVGWLTIAVYSSALSHLGQAEVRQLRSRRHYHFVTVMFQLCNGWLAVTWDSASGLELGGGRKTSSCNWPLVSISGTLLCTLGASWMWSKWHFRLCPPCARMA